ncbi:RmlC-like cupin domain-containing protein [Phaeosphaeriaceae sp. PMI808]|nr:RmlC-like cupin domain-containing protein [Phaeosphaeriaceae sp. PMI808]
MLSLRFLFPVILPLMVAAQSKSRTANTALNAALTSAATNFDRHALLSNDSDWYFDFNQHPNYNSSNGAVVIADAASMPALMGQGISISLLKLAACGLLPPHVHPRATNLVTAITGNTTSWMIAENGVKTQRVNLKPMRMTIFPIGSLHVMQNNDCEPAILISALSSDDSGTLNILPALWSVPQDIIRAGFGDATLNTQDLGRDIPGIGTGDIIGSEECKKRCGLSNEKEYNWGYSGHDTVVCCFLQY